MLLSDFKYHCLDILDDIGLTEDGYIASHYPRGNSPGLKGYIFIYCMNDEETDDELFFSRFNVENENLILYITNKNYEYDLLHFQTEFNKVLFAESLNENSKVLVKFENENQQYKILNLEEGRLFGCGCGGDLTINISKEIL